MPDPLSRGAWATELLARQSLIAAALQLSARGIHHGRAGQLSCRWRRSASDGFLITPVTPPFRLLEPEDIVWVQFKGNELHRETLKLPMPEGYCHHDLYLARADIVAIVSCQSPYAASLACQLSIMENGVPAFHHMMACFGGTDLRCAAVGGLGAQAGSGHVIRAMEGRNACLLASRGLLAAGGDLPEALERADDVERLSQMYGLTLQLGTPALSSLPQG